MIPYNQIIDNARAFSYKWAGTTNENSEAKPFWHEFFEIFGLSRKRIGSFEHAVDLYNGKKGYIDFFWKGTLIIEHKSAGKNLDKAFGQALDYFSGLSEDDLPRYVITSDFERIRVYDLDKINKPIEFPLTELYKNIHVFDFITNYKSLIEEDDEEITIKAGILIGNLYNSLLKNNYNKDHLSVLIVRLLFCFFADHTDIWIKHNFKNFIINHTQADGIDLGSQLNAIFEILDTKEEYRQTNISPILGSFSYINGGLFKDRISTPIFTKESRELLITCCRFTWENISPSIIGSIFQNVMSLEDRKTHGVTYTSEKDILKLIKPLFLDSLVNRFEKNKYNLRNLEKLNIEISKIKILDPACGCGNFLITTYKELRILQLDIIKQIKLIKSSSQYEQCHQISLGIPSNTLDVNSMYGFDIDDFATQIAKVALWLEDHKMNNKYSSILGCSCDRIPLKSSANIFKENALQIDWNDFIVKDDFTFIIGNPPYIPSYKRKYYHNLDMDNVFNNYSIKNYKKLDYVSCWYLKAYEFIKNTNIKVAFVSTNSIVQGEQAIILWRPLFTNGLVINFAYQSFKWSNGLSKDASVHVVIIGFSCINNTDKIIYTNSNNNVNVIQCSNINEYLRPRENIYVSPSKNHIYGNYIPKATKGSMPNDDKNLIIEADQYIALPKEVKDSILIRPFVTAKAMLNNIPRWCIWLDNINLEDVKKIKFFKKRFDSVYNYRNNLYLKEKKENIKRALETPYLFETRNQPTCDYIAIPRHNTISRRYIPMKICNKSEIIGDSCVAIHTDDKYYLGILMSQMHMCWIKEFCGKLKEDYRYSHTICYNTFPFPTTSNIQKEKIRSLVKNILIIRSSYSSSSLADLYNPLFTPKDLLDAHRKLDSYVEKLYKKGSFKNDDERLNHLLTIYKSITNL